MSQGIVQSLERPGVKPFARERQQLVDCIRMLEKAEIIDFNGHCSIRVSDDRILINQGNCQRSQLTVDDIVTIDMDGKLVEGSANPPLEFHLHTGVYRARADVRAVVHAHPKWSTYLTMTGHAYQPVFAQGVLPGEAPVLDTPASINTPAMADTLAQVLGERSSALMKSHGAVTVGKDIVEAFVLAVYLEENAQRQYMALQIGKPYVFTAEEQQAAMEKLWTASLFRRTWDHYRAKLI
ncbi:MULTISPECIES: class II aldolase/adducin family protein [unclassified Beijerinckia]|uniref:class II aldolase/adducin family protein n=1 Tax=unclassified Beijerinckia TaxID=2638183 RepID=UPI000897BA42|nr:MULTISPECIES: class II aldolase/adducin family protein [unclassified Beijerinckia]MDH7799404.1 L-fuculose-phosphate aldolase [Beijerinckia sp. GAS462]SED49231.1 L-fuculose-phosphate aldolase [Beijerinckia sp. 28-YEA-48]